MVAGIVVVAALLMMGIQFFWVEEAIAKNRLVAQRNVGFPRLEPREPSFQPHPDVGHGPLSSQ